MFLLSVALVVAIILWLYTVVVLFVVNDPISLVENQV